MEALFFPFSQDKLTEEQIEGIVQLRFTCLNLCRVYKKRLKKQTSKNNIDCHLKGGILDLKVQLKRFHTLGLHSQTKK